jgi:AhpD family alkylhydroperoxidase
VPLLPLVSDADAAPDARATLQALRAKLGTVPAMYHTLANAPHVLDAAVGMAAAIRTGLAPRLRELAYLKVADLTGCHVCRHYHDALGRRAGLTDAQMAGLGDFENSDAYTEHERDVLRFAAQWSAAGRVAEAVLARLAADLTPEHLVTLAATVAQANFTCRFNNVFGVEL